MENITVIRNFMIDQGVKYLLVNATNEFLVEYNTLEENLEKNRKENDNNNGFREYKM